MAFAKYSRLKTVVSFQLFWKQITDNGQPITKNYESNATYRKSKR